MYGELLGELAGQYGRRISIYVPETTVKNKADDATYKRYEPEFEQQCAWVKLYLCNMFYGA